jgi:hypothetical protein
MNCGDRAVHVAAHSSYSVSCSVDAWESGYHKIRVDFGRDLDPRIYSNVFRIKAKECATAYLDSYRCLYNWRQRLYQRSDCNQEWRDYEYCSIGCASDKCIQPAASVSLKDSYEVEQCKVTDITFDVINTGNTRTTYRVSTTGVNWLNTIPSVALEPNERKTLTAYASVPCNAAGSYDFSVVVSDGTASKANSVLKVSEKVTGSVARTDYSGDVWNIALALLIALIVLLVIRAFFKMPRCRAYRRLRAEERF